MKTKPKLDMPFKDYIYCCENRDKYFLRYYKGKFREVASKIYTKQEHAKELGNRKLNGKIIGEFVCNEIDEYTCGEYNDYFISDDEIIETCLSRDQLYDYGKGKTLYGWHITDLKIYDKPKALGEFNLSCNHNNNCHKCNYWDYFQSFSDGHCLRREKDLTKPPQSWCYVEELK